jgi:hypothetical protein
MVRTMTAGVDPSRLPGPLAFLKMPARAAPPGGVSGPVAAFVIERSDGLLHPAVRPSGRVHHHHHERKDEITALAGLSLEYDLSR